MVDAIGTEVVVPGKADVHVAGVFILSPVCTDVDKTSIEPVVKVEVEVVVEVAEEEKEGTAPSLETITDEAVKADPCAVEAIVREFTKKVKKSSKSMSNDGMGEFCIAVSGTVKRHIFDESAGCWAASAVNSKFVISRGAES